MVVLTSPAHHCPLIVLTHTEAGLSTRANVAREFSESLSFGYCPAGLNRCVVPTVCDRCIDAAHQRSAVETRP